MATDKSLRSGDVGPLANEISNSIRQGIVHRFEKAYKFKKSSDKSTEKGRDYVEAYVDLTHYLEGVHHIATEGPSHKHRVK